MIEFSWMEKLLLIRYNAMRRNTNSQTEMFELSG